MDEEDLAKKLEEYVRKKVVSIDSPVINRTSVIGYLARLSDKELRNLLEEVRKLRNGVWKPLKQTKKYKEQKEEELK